jgi:Tfp pilus assembly protein PilF
MMNVGRHADAVALLAEFYEKHGQPDKAREALRSLADYLATKATLNNNLYNWSPPTDWRTQVRGKSV